MSGFPHLDPVQPLLTDETGLRHLMDPYEILEEHPDLTLVVAPLPVGERGRWYPELGVIMISERLNQAERRCTLTHELVHRMRGDEHISDDLANHRQEKACHRAVARILIPFPTLLAALTYDRDPQELADELWVDLETLQARICSLTPVESASLREVIGDDEWVVA